MEVLDSLISAVRRCCGALPDKRRGANGSYTMADIGMAAFALFFTQSPSFLAFQRRLKHVRMVEEIDSSCLLRGGRTATRRSLCAGPSAIRSERPRA